jgi:hypothetical protein
MRLYQNKNKYFMSLITGLILFVVGVVGTILFFIFLSWVENNKK